MIQMTTLLVVGSRSAKELNWMFCNRSEEITGFVTGFMQKIFSWREYDVGENQRKDCF